MNINIYQINSDRDKNNMLFLSYDHLEKFQGSFDVDSSIYDKVYEGNVDTNSLEGVFTKFNLNRPPEFIGHSLSVSDIVEIVDNSSSSGLENGFYFCDSIGFKKVNFEPKVSKDTIDVSSKFIFDDELLINDDRESMNGYLWAMDALVDKLPASQEMENINFYADYNVLTGEIQVWSSFYVPDEHENTGEKNETVDVFLTEQEKTELIDVLKSYCQARYSQSCLEFVNEVRASEGLEMIKVPLAEQISSVDLVKDNQPQNHQVKRPDFSY